MKSVKSLIAVHKPVETDLSLGNPNMEREVSTSNYKISLSFSSNYFPGNIKHNHDTRRVISNSSNIHTLSFFYFKISHGIRMCSLIPTMQTNFFLLLISFHCLSPQRIHTRSHPACVKAMIYYSLKFRQRTCKKKKKQIAIKIR